MSAYKSHEAKIRLSSPAYLLSLAAILAAPQVALAGPDPCEADANSIDCQGDQSAGIALRVPPAPGTLRVGELAGPIQPASGDGIRYTSGAGSDLTLYSGRADAPVTINTTGANARGIYLESIGTAPTPPNDPLLNVPVPGTPGVSGGVITVENYGDITTGGRGAHGIYGYSSTSGYPQPMITALENFSSTGITFALTGVADPDGGELQAVTADAAVTLVARVVERVPLKEVVNPGEPTPLFAKFEVRYGATGGSFTVEEDGSFSFDPGTDFDDLAEGETRTVKVLISLDGYRGGTDPLRTGETGDLSARVENVGGTLVTRTSVEFHTFGLVEFGEATSGTAWPDLDVYVRGRANTSLDPAIDNSIPGLLGEARGVSGGAGSTVNLAHLGGTIATSGAAAHGVYAHSQGQRGPDGRDGGGFWSFGTRPPRVGGDGNDGGDVNLHIDGTVITRFEPAEDAAADASIGVLAHSQGGAGGTGGDGGFYYGGRRGGAGGDGMAVTVTGSGTIETFGHYGTGVFAVSEGGDGGGGGDGGVFAGGYTGGFGGRGGDVHAEGNWDVITRGDAAHGIWAKSAGGNAGNGGSGGWLFGAAGSGGQATDGGDVTLRGGGTITTWGADAFGLFGQSVGGFGGSGGTGRSLFYSRGGDGESAGSGGAVSVTNLASGSVTTHGQGSHALVSLSVGGGGGAGGSAGGIVAVGGDGASGGNGGEVTALNQGSLETFGGFARGLYAQSVGGGGGDGGSTGGLVSIGGAGGGGGDGGSISVDNQGAIDTGGAWAEAIFAQSIGGGGGSGGSAVGWFSIGGSGGAGGQSSPVMVHNEGALTTVGPDSVGIFAQSVGGGGGSGGNSVAAGAFVSLAIGGTGGEGGPGSSVDVTTNDGAISTTGDRSRGIDAQSVGGGGGRGGFAISGSIGLGGSIAVGVGGNGSGGGDADTVTVNSGSDITTRGADAQGIFAQSIGGGGGSGGFSISGAASDGIGVALAFGGQGGTGGASDRVEVTSSGEIATAGLRSVGLFAQSIGGGGGSGGFTIAAGGGGLGAFSLGLGGDGGGGGNAAAVEVASSGAITTQGDEAHGLQAQSVGGGGGSGGFTITGAGAGVGAAAISIGGAGGGGGDGDTVEVTSSGEIATAGAGAIGLFAQSVGGGGGSGGFSISGAGAGTGAGTFSLGGAGEDGGEGSLVTVASTSDITTQGVESHALFAQSLGGGGGRGGFSISGSGAGTGAATFGLGGTAGAGGGSERVDVTSSGTLITRGAGAVGLFAQSVGGGGGTGGFSIAGAGAGTGAGTFSLGGAGGDGGDGHEVAVQSTSDIHTFGLESHALFAQSVGGGGGSGGFSITGSGAGTGAASFGLGGRGAGGGDSKRVDVTSTGVLVTEGASAVGLFAQSVGGGGGTGGFSIAGTGAGTGGGTFSLGGAGGDGGDGHEVRVDSGSDIHTFGLESHALFAQSVGGGGGSGGFTIAGAGAGTGAGTFSLGGSGGGGGDSKRVDVTSSGTLVTQGAEAVGLFAQSVGGGGGRGGFTIAGTGGGTGAATFGLGGSGGDGGDGHEVSVQSASDIHTFGLESHALFAQSVGGGGGTGGFSIAGTYGGKGAGTFSLGGSGGDGGDARRVDVTSSGTLVTEGEDAIGLFAQSVGGGGGKGGFSISGAIGAGGEAVTASLGIGGSGGLGGAAGEVEVHNTGDLWMQGDGASGIVGQSIGGGGGQGGFSIAGVVFGKYNASVSIGGRGGDGGAGKSVRIDNLGDIRTEGQGAHGIRAESTSDGGGDGGFSLAGSLGGSEAKNLSVAVGGSGGKGGAAGTVEVDSDGVIATSGDGSHGIMATSIGGGGGTGGSAVSVGFGVTGEKGWNVNASIAVGGTGGDGGIGGDVRVGSLEAPVRGLLQTTGEDAHGIFAQSIGGGGGTGGSSTAINIDVDRPKSKSKTEGNSLNASLSLGGGGGTGNSAGVVEIETASDIATYGAQSHAILAQSIGGGGGSGGRASAISLSTGDLVPWAEMQGDNWGLDVSVGGGGGDANTGGRVTVVNHGNLYTEGTLARGIFAQSIGGGGGSGAQGIVGTGVDWLDDALDFLSPAQMAFALKGAIESDDPLSLLPRSGSVSVGGNGGDSGHADAVRVENFGDIATLGMSSHAIFAQSVGGGGGEAQLYARGLGEGAEATAGALGQFALGGAGGAAGDGSSVEILHAGRIVTEGQAASGIFAQSIGGGGGQAGSITGGLSGLDPWSIGLGVAFGRDGGSAGDGGRVSVASAGEIVTHGEAAVAVFAQSIGGGGGIIGDVDGIAFAGSVGGYGAGGDVSVEHDGVIVTRGDAAHGIFAQSVGGADDGDYEGRGGTVNVTISGHIEAGGANASAILAQSLGGGALGNGDISVHIAGGTVRGGSGAGAGVRLLDGADNLVMNYGTVSALSDLAIAAGSGGDRVENRGVLSGSVDLGAGANSLLNHFGAVINSGATLGVGAGNTFTNTGRLSPGGDGVVASTTIIGDLVQTGQGRLALDIDTRSGTADRLDVSGSASLAGELAVRMLDVGYVMPGSHTLSLVGVGAGVLDAGLTLDAPELAVVRYDLAFDDDAGLLLNYVVDFSAPEGLSGNQGALGGYINAVQLAGGSGSFAPITAKLMSLADRAALGAVYEQLSPATHLGGGEASLASNLQFSNAMLSCRQPTGEYRFIAEDDCGWLRLAGQALDQDPRGDMPGFEERIIGVAGGMQREVSEDMHVGGALSYETGRTRSKSVSKTDLDRFQVGVMLKHRRQATLVAGGLSVGFSDFDTTRYVDLPEPGVEATSQQDMLFVGLRGRLAHTLERENSYVQPMIDANVTYAHFDGFTERGAGAANLVVRSRDETYVSVNPALELGLETDAVDGGYTRIYGRIGAIHYLSGTPEITSMFAGAPAGVAPFRTKGDLDSTYLDLAVGVDLLNGDRLGMKLEYAAQWSDNTEQQGVQLRFNRRF